MRKKYHFIVELELKSAAKKIYEKADKLKNEVFVNFYTLSEKKYFPNSEKCLIEFFKVNCFSYVGTYTGKLEKKTRINKKIRSACPAFKTRWTLYENAGAELLTHLALAKMGINTLSEPIEQKF